MIDKKGLVLLCGLSVLWILSSCTTLKDSRPVNSVAALQTAVEKLWSARVQKDWETVYFLTDQEYQQKTPKEKFKALEELKALEYQVKHIKTVDDENAVVRIKFKIRRMGFLLNPTMEEFWLFEPNNGWVLNKTKMFSKKPF